MKVMLSDGKSWCQMISSRNSKPQNWFWLQIEQNYVSHANFVFTIYTMLRGNSKFKLNRLKYWITAITDQDNDNGKSNQKQ